MVQCRSTHRGRRQCPDSAQVLVVYKPIIYLFRPNGARAESYFLIFMAISGLLFFKQVNFNNLASSNNSVQVEDACCEEELGQT